MNACRVLGQSASNNVIQGYGSKVKPPKNMVYKIPCSSNRSYVGRTSRPALKLVHEHMKNLDTQPTVPKYLNTFMTLGIL